MRIGGLTLPEGAVLAPMAGVTDHVTRLISHEYGAAWSVTEMINAQGYCCAPENQAAIERLLFRSPDEGIVGVQLFGRTPEHFARAAAELEARGFDFIDINMGCPARKVVSGGSGSALMREPELCGSIVAAVRGAVKIPVTVKMRAGWSAEEINAPEIAHICEDNGADAVTVHGRTKEMQYSGEADLGIIKKVKESVSIPVIGNGDIRSYESTRRMREATGCDAVAVGRGACGNPWVFRDILSGQDTAPSPRVRTEAALRHLEMLAAVEGERHGVIEARKHIAWYLYGIRGASVVRTKIMTANTVIQVKDILSAFAESFPAEEQL